MRDVVVVGAFVGAVVVSVVQPFTRGDVAASAYVDALSSIAVDRDETVLVHPPWRDDAVAAVRAAHLDGVDDAHVTEAFAPRHGDSWPDLLIVADARWPLPRALRDRAVVVDHVATDNVDVYRVAGDVSADVSTVDLAAADVFVVDDHGARVDCPWSKSAQRHVCTGLPAWMHVGDETLTIDGRPQRCTWSHPRDDATLVVDYGVIAVSGGVHVDVALTDGAAANATGAAVHARIVVDDEDGSVDVHHDRGFHGVDIDVGDKKSAHVRLEFTTAHDGQRHTCYRLSTSKAQP